jgi:hypothetical protein
MTLEEVVEALDELEGERVQVVVFGLGEEAGLVATLTGRFRRVQAPDLPELPEEMIGC